MIFNHIIKYYRLYISNIKEEFKIREKNKYTSEIEIEEAELISEKIVLYICAGG